MYCCLNKTKFPLASELWGVAIVDSSCHIGDMIWTGFLWLKCTTRIQESGKQTSVVRGEEKQGLENVSRGHCHGCPRMIKNRVLWSGEFKKGVELHNP